MFLKMRIEVRLSILTQDYNYIQPSTYSNVDFKRVEHEYLSHVIIDEYSTHLIVMAVSPPWYASM